MQKRILSVAVFAILLFSLFNWNCTKFDTTDIGSDLLPAVDNVQTFDTILNINSTQGLFSDTSYIDRTENFALGAVNNDPLFGKTNAHIFMQLKPAFFPYYMGGSPGDTLNGFGAMFDSVVLCLNFKRFWGDSTLPIHLEVREINDLQFGSDSVYKDNPTNYHPIYSGVVLGSADVDVRALGDYIKFNNGRDSVNYQVRIRLDQIWGQNLYNRDSTASNLLNNAFYSDSIYRRFYPGLAVLANGAGSNGLLYVNLADTATKIEIHYKRRNLGKVDSVYTSLRLNASLSGNGTIAPSNTANNIVRNRAGSQMMSPGPEEHFLQTAPGSFVNLKIPGLAGLPNLIIHRAEVIVEQIPTDPTLDENLSAPNFLYLDLKDTGTTDKWKPVYFDLNTTQPYDPDYKNGFYYLPISQTGSVNVDYNYFGGYKRNKPDAFGNQIKFYNFNITRYIQQVVTKRTPAYDMRLYSPFYLEYSQYSPARIAYANNIAYGRVRIGSGSNLNYKLRLRIVYSKLK